MCRCSFLSHPLKLSYRERCYTKVQHKSNLLHFYWNKKLWISFLVSEYLKKKSFEQSYDTSITSVSWFKCFGQVFVLSDLQMINEMNIQVIRWKIFMKLNNNFLDLCKLEKKRKKNIKNICICTLPHQLHQLKSILLDIPIILTENKFFSVQQQFS